MSEHPAAKRHRAYAQAVDEAFAQRGYLDGHKDGYAAGVQAARDAVAALLPRFTQTDGWLMGQEIGAALDAALAAIDALKGEQA